ncbi:serine protease 33 isoform X2 [Maniola hyperantus]|uniref:serine protease 33 isoform X2 n=1 Tax=Aphantopus hyperantus TaxID=2795564 RepID=UPI003747A16D
MFANGWKVFLIVAASCAVGEPSRALTLYQKPRTYPMFIPKTRRKYSRILFLDDEEKNTPIGLGEIDLTQKFDSKIKFDDSTDYEFTSPDTDLKIDGNERFYELQRLRPSFPKFYQGRFSRPYAPNFGFDPYQSYAPPRTGFYGPNVLSNGWKARSPRVVFPYTPESGSNSVNAVSPVSSVNPVNSVQTNSHSGPNFNDNVVFREPNSGNEIGAEEQTLQDISSGADAFSERGCGVAVGKQTAQRRIVGGDDAGFGTFPWQAYIRIGSSRCGGSLISRRHVVTAGHCVARAQPRHVRVTLGDYVINSAAEPLPAYTFGVRTIKVHPLFKFTPQADRFDVAVLTLDRNVHYMPHIAPICLPERGSDYLGQYGWAAGWGALSPGSRLRPRTLQAVDVPVLDNRVCERWHRANGINVVIYPEMLCAGYRGGGKDSCQGDSGGPLMLERAGRWYLIGVVSAGYSCASRGQPGIYHRVAHTVDWISHATTLS